MSEGKTAWQKTGTGLLLSVKAMPRSRRPGLAGLAPLPEGAALRVAVSEPPEDGRASRAVCALLAKALGLKAADVTLVSGMSSRQKQILLTGDPEKLAASLTHLLENF